MKHRTILCLLYGSGLRIGELLNLRIGDIDSKRMRIRVLGAKGKKDRYTVLGTAQLEALRNYYKKYQVEHDKCYDQNNVFYNVKCFFYHFLYV